MSAKYYVETRLPGLYMYYSSDSVDFITLKGTKLLKAIKSCNMVAIKEEDELDEESENKGIVNFDVTELYCDALVKSKKDTSLPDFPPHMKLIFDFLKRIGCTLEFDYTVFDEFNADEDGEFNDHMYEYSFINGKNIQYDRGLLGNSQ